ncbi:DUF1840 family protein [Rubrivivax albus]|uniref:DUF1840 domain-containing protein n=1 Tax=Rubrivivax albus TaxID=2499835 RepID=A0A3S2TM31_9BURK|nr:DUF1840 family protein [Rubrivivax albus]RVT51438.1 DUF1840 domain-containing protein [Rubrivivax albus]
MIYRFRSPAAGDVVMLGASGDELLRILGREPAAQGIIEPPAMPAAIAALQAAVAAAEAPADTEDHEADGSERQRGVSLRQRVWPMMEMLKRAHAEDAPVVWGV